MATREFIALLAVDEETASRYDEANGFEETSPLDFLEREFGWLETSGVSLTECALVDGDDLWECYLRYLTQWAIDHWDDKCKGMSPACYDEWVGWREDEVSYGCEESLR